jgi:hypothetical protein
MINIYISKPMNGFFSVINNGNSKYLSHTPDICMALDLYESVDGALSRLCISDGFTIFGYQKDSLLVFSL